MAVKVSLYLDERKIEVGEKAPIKLRLYISRTDIRHYSTGVYLTNDQFENSYLAKKARKGLKETKIELEGIIAKANRIIKKMDEGFVLSKFEREMFGNVMANGDIVGNYNNYIKNLNDNGRASTADTYRLSLRSILTFAGSDKKPATSLAFTSITVDFLNRYEKWMAKEERSKTTVGIYLRSLRSIFNTAIEQDLIPADIYPFKKYKIPTGQNVKLALDKSALKKLYTAKLEPGSIKAKARDFWFFSYQCNGMNFRDIAELKHKNIHQNSFSFLRHKTLYTAKDKPKPIIVPLTDNVKAFIAQYGGKPSSPDDYVFPIFSKGMSELEKLRINQNFIRFINQHLQKLADDLELGISITTYSARHTFTTSAIRNGAKMELIQESLGHHSLATTQNYWAGFEDNVKQEIAEKLMNFD